MKRFEMMLTTTLRKNVGPLMSKQNDESCLWEEHEP